MLSQIKAGYKAELLVLSIAVFTSVVFAFAGVNDDLIEAASNMAGLPVIRQILAKGADVNFHAKAKGGWTPLMYASSYGEFDVVEFMVSKGAEVNAKDNDGETVLMHACEMEYPEGPEPPSESGHYLVVTLLLTKGADVNAKTTNGTSALILASRYGHRRIVDLLRKSGAK